jgi:glycosyltransferase involved in cell wall biosynthesis
VKLAVVVQRYGQTINGGAELHARYIAEHLARHADVEVLTTCALDYVTWRNELPAGVESVNGVTVRRFPVRHERDPHVFGRRSIYVFERPHSIHDELKWLDSEGPTSPALIRYLREHGGQYDHCLIFSYRYHHAYFGVRALSSRAILVPTAERDTAIGLAIFQPIFRGVRALMYNSPEERTMIRAVSGNDDVPEAVVGIGSEIAQNPQASRFRQKFDIRGPFAIYIGRIDENKGCRELFEFFQGYVRAGEGELSLVLIGHPLLPVPEHPRIRHLGFLDDQDKFDAIAASDVLLMPSYFESLSMVALEAWALGRPVLANGKCDVLKGQCLRSNAGLYYDTYGEFVEALRTIEHSRWLNAALGANGRHFFREHYDWPVIERKYLQMFDRLSRQPAARALEPLPGWFDRRRRVLPPGVDVAARLPSGPAPAVPRERGQDVAQTAAAPAEARHHEPARTYPPANRGSYSGSHSSHRSFNRGRGQHRQRRGSHR